LNNVARNILLWIVALMVLVTIFSATMQKPELAKKVAYSDFIQMVRNNEITEAEMNQQSLVHTEIHAKTLDGEKIVVQKPDDPGLIKFDSRPPQEDSMLFTLLRDLLPVILFIGLWLGGFSQGPHPFPASWRPYSARCTHGWASRYG